MELRRYLCQKEYDRKVFQAARQELVHLEKLESIYQGAGHREACDTIYENMQKERKALITPVRCTDEEYRKQWENAAYKKKEIGKDAPELFTNKGEQVRSKSEILIANALEKHDIPYRYEAPLMLKGYGLIHPDFTVLNVKLRKEFYLEHLGLMDDEEYRENALRRVLAYERAGIFPGEQLILTHETGKCPLDVRIVEKLITHYLT